jgi:hypothetical protein
MYFKVFGILKSNIVKDEMLYAKAIEPYIEYWEVVLECLSKPFSKKNPILLEDFFLII